MGENASTRPISVTWSDGSAAIQGSGIHAMGITTRQWNSGHSTSTRSARRVGSSAGLQLDLSGDTQLTVACTPLSSLGSSTALTMDCGCGKLAARTARESLTFDFKCVDVSTMASIIQQTFRGVSTKPYIVKISKANVASFIISGRSAASQCTDESAPF